MLVRRGVRHDFQRRRDLCAYIFAIRATRDKWAALDGVAHIGGRAFNGRETPSATFFIQAR
jgi:hypothetical protein